MTPFNYCESEFLSQNVKVDPRGGPTGTLLEPPIIVAEVIDARSAQRPATAASNAWLGDTLRAFIVGDEPVQQLDVPLASFNGRQLSAINGEAVDRLDDLA